MNSSEKYFKNGYYRVTYFPNISGSSYAEVRHKDVPTIAEAYAFTKTLNTQNVLEIKWHNTDES
jgi:hypothetical protein